MIVSSKMMSAGTHRRMGEVCCSRSGSTVARFAHHLQLRPSLSCLNRPRKQPLSSFRLQAADQSQPPERRDVGHEEQQLQQQFTVVEQQQQQQQRQSTAESALDNGSVAGSAAASAADQAEQHDPEWQQLQQEQNARQQQHQVWCKTARTAYLALSATLAATGLLVSVTAAPLAAAGLKLGAGLPQQQAAVLVGCLGAAILRGASLASFLAEGAAHGELGSWRYQRVNVGLAVAALSAAVAAAVHGWAGAQPWLVLPAVGVCSAAAAACTALAAGQARLQGFYFASALGYGNFADRVSAMWVYVLYNVTCLPSALMMAVAVGSVVLGMAALTGSAALPVLPWVAASSSGAAAATLMHKLLGAGLLLLALQAWVLMEYASNARSLSPEQAVKLLFARTGEEYAQASGQLRPAPVHVPMQRFILLHVGYIGAAVAQGLWVAQATAAGSGVGLLNLSDPLWGSLVWSVMASVLYMFVLVGQVDYADIVAIFKDMMNWAGRLVQLGAAALFVDWTWLSATDRK